MDPENRLDVIKAVVLLCFLYTAARCKELHELRTKNVQIRRDNCVYLHFDDRKNRSLFFFVNWSFFFKQDNPLPRHSEALYSPATWFCRYLFFVRQDGVAPTPEEFFFRCLEKGKFTKKRLGYKKFSLFLKDCAEANGYDRKDFSGLFIFFFGFYFYFFAFLGLKVIVVDVLQPQFWLVVVLIQHKFKHMALGPTVMLPIVMWLIICPPSNNVLN